jgi:F420H(2)-dependent quinone reductase
VGRVPSYDPLAPKGLRMSALSWAARQPPVTWFLVNVGNKIDPYLMRVSGGRLKSTVELWTKGGGGRYRAKEATGKRRERLWNLATGFYPGFATYQERAGDRRIPVIVCSPQDE